MFNLIICKILILIQMYYNSLVIKTKVFNILNTSANITLVIFYFAINCFICNDIKFRRK